ncbi:MAG: flippase-like domain-containing protein, partial [Deltaproteobacteria bacterium]|nr:flippase-like domain-containing protein [Deltaproteobacteria bacterium]
MKTKVNIILGSLVGLLFVWLAFRGTDIEGLKSSFKAVKYIYIVPVVFLSIVVLVLRSYRWGVILE